MRADGSRLRRLTKTPRLEEHCPAWSPNGRLVAFTRRGVLPADLYVMRADGSHVRRVLKLRGDEICPRWSPDGTRLVFVRMDNTLPTTVHAVYTVRLDGRGLRKLTGDDAWEIADWARSGRIVFESTTPPETGLNIWSSRVDGGDRRMIAGDATDANYRHPRWSPNGRRILFTNDQDGREQLWTMNADGSGMARVTSGGVNSFDPAWSPDGRKIVYVRTVANTQPEIFVAATDGSGERRLTQSRRIDTEPDWR
jgi:TolB protein